MQSHAYQVVLLTESRLLNRAIEKSLDASRFATHVLASNIPDLAEKLSSLSPDFIFLSTSLKETSGYVLRDRLRAHLAFQKTRFIFLSSDEGSPSQEERATLKDGEHLLQIPFTTEAVSQLLSSLTSGKKTILYADDTKFFHNVVVIARFHLLTGKNMTGDMPMWVFRNSFRRCWKRELRGFR